MRFLWKAVFVCSAAARVLWVPAEFVPGENGFANTHRLISRGGVSCGAGYPSDFTCPTDTQCLSLSTTSTKAVLCCPAGEDCQIINPVNCDQSLQNATLLPNSQLHADPTVPLNNCGGGCCPMGYSCNASQCQAQSAPPPATSAISTTHAISSTTALTPTSPSTPTSAPYSTSTPESTTVPGVGIGGNAPAPSSTSSKFSAAYFAAGFVPGIFLGALLTACLLLILFRKKKSSDSSLSEKQRPRDTLTDLTTLSRRPTTHGRSISQPTVDATMSRTDFLRGPLQGTYLDNSYSIDIVGAASAPRTPSRTPKAVQALFRSRSPFLRQTPSTPLSTQAPLPSHMKRGTLSFKISPVRALRKQKSQYSLRRQMTNGSRGSDRRMTRSGSTETIQVLMPHNEPWTPNQRPTQGVEPPATLASSVYRPRPHAAVEAWRGSQVSELEVPGAVHFGTSQQYSTELNANPRLGTPYTPSKYTGGNGTTLAPDYNRVGALDAPARADKRVTTFSALMERAGLGKADYMVGGGEHDIRKRPW
ncbi:hypothetical protein LTR62_005513 [Meristemomyces frigidus]|uniref:Uncharacterized protein n=1 Tax=Meristemomyces frigidus TaxID=1508187 RepID=A0AAN7TEE3_9PEZI|nr:hypothetical protein LTR62_005513 [Meristemomyces frigidus]